MEAVKAGIGARTTEALLRRDSNPAPFALAGLLSGGSAEVARLVAKRVVAAPEIAEAVLGTDTLSAGSLAMLAEAQIASGEAPSSPTAWCAAVLRLGDGPISPASLVTCYAASLKLDGDAGLPAARRLYDSVQSAARRHHLPPGHARYLEKALCGGARGWGLARALVASALCKWPPHGSSARALTVSWERDHYRDLVDGAIERLGKETVANALLDADVSPGTRAYVESRLEGPSKKYWWF